MWGLCAAAPRALAWIPNTPQPALPEPLEVQGPDRRPSAHGRLRQQRLREGTPKSGLTMCCWCCQQHHDEPSFLFKAPSWLKLCIRLLQSDRTATVALFSSVLPGAGEAHSARLAKHGLRSRPHVARPPGTMRTSFSQRPAGHAPRTRMGGNSQSEDLSIVGCLGKLPEGRPS